MDAIGYAKYLDLDFENGGGDGDGRVILLADRRDEEVVEVYEV
jgi:hypothetical protein